MTRARPKRARTTAAPRDDVPRYPFVAVDVAPADADAVAARLFELGASGVEERDDGTLRKGASAGRARVVGSFADHAAARRAIRRLRERHGLRAELEEVVGDGWRDEYKKHFAPFRFTEHVLVAPPWDVPAEPPEPGVHVLVLDPGRAFGTGLHATTTLVARALDERRAALAGATVLDVGTGSGILALVALALGASRAIAIDNDPDVIEVVRENAERNGLAARVEASDAPLERVDGRFPFVLANIETKVLRPMAPELARRVAPGGLLLLSGILGGEQDALRAHYAALGLEPIETRLEGDAAGEPWVLLALRAP